MDLTALLNARKSVRAFRSEPIPAETLRRIFEAAQHAPSWCNIQPWRVWVASGAVRTQLCAEMTKAAEGGMMSPDFQWPGEYPEPYGTHRRECGRALYEAMGVARNDAAARQAAWMRNYVAFDAPHVAIVGLDKRLGVYGVLDVGVWLEAFLLMCEEAGVGTCPQACLGAYPNVPRALFGIPETVGVLFGIALGYEDKTAAANTCRTSRAPIDANITFVG